MTTAGGRRPIIDCQSRPKVKNRAVASRRTQRPPSSASNGAASSEARTSACAEGFDAEAPMTGNTTALQILCRMPRTDSESFRSPSSSRVLIVPSGVSVATAISRWLIP